MLLDTELEIQNAEFPPAWAAGIFRVAGIYGPSRGHLYQQLLRGEARVAGHVGDGGHRAGRDGGEHDVMGLEDAVHLDHDAAAQAVDLDVVDAGEEAGLAEDVGPAAGVLASHEVVGVVEGEFLEGGGGLGDVAIRYGFHRYDVTIMAVTVVMLIVLVQIIQSIGDAVVRRVDHR